MSKLLTSTAIVTMALVQPALAASNDGGGAEGTIFIFLFMLGICLYFLPSFIASARHHHNIGGIVVVNFFLGWTFLGWVAALAWSVTAIRKPYE